MSQSSSFFVVWIESFSLITEWIKDLDQYSCSIGFGHNFAIETGFHGNKSGQKWTENKQFSNTVPKSLKHSVLVCHYNFFPGNDLLPISSSSSNPPPFLVKDILMEDKS